MNNSEKTQQNNTDHSSSFNALTEERETAKYAADRVKYTGIFLNPEEVYSKFPPHLSCRIRDPHVTVTYRPGAERILLDALGSGAKITAIGYGNNGYNEGLLVKVEANDPAIQKNLDEREEIMDDTGKTKQVPTHITLSISEGAEAVNTRNLSFQPLSEPIEFSGTYRLFCNDGTLVSSKKTVQEMQQREAPLKEIEDPDRPGN